MIRSLNYLARRGAAWLHRRLLPPLPQLPEPPVQPYAQWIAQRVCDRRTLYPTVEERGLFSLMTPVFDPPVGYFRVLGKSIFAQEHTDWQWVLIDNGCQNQDVLFLLEQFARDPRVTLVKSPEPRGIIGGMRLALEHATGRYVCPVDHDDRLYPDALRVVAACLQACDWPALAYTDEDKLLLDGQPGLPSFKPDWDPLLFLNACYIAHLGVMDRQLALELELYTDPEAEGTPDGDAFSRFVAAGYEPVHLPEIVYSWRMHEQSTALRGVEAKPYVTANQRHVLSRYLKQLGLEETVQVRTNSLPGIAGSWRVELVGAATAVEVCVLPGGTPDQRRQVHQRLDQSRDLNRIHWLENMTDVPASLADDDWLVLLAPQCLPMTTDFVQEWQAVVSARRDAVLAGGILQTAGIVHSAGLAWGMGGLCNSPLAGLPMDDHGIGLGALCFQRTVSGVDHRFCMIQAGFLRHVLLRSGSDLGDPLLGAWLGALAREQGKQVVFTPHVTAHIDASALDRTINETDRFRFLRQHGQLLSVDPYYARYQGLTAETAYQPVKPGLRTVVLRKTLSALADNIPEYRTWAGSNEEFPSFLDTIGSRERVQQRKRDVA